MSAEDFQGLVRRHRDRVFNLALYSLRHREDAEDVTQEVLIRLWNHRRQLEGPRVGAWLTRVTRNACFDLMRRHGARRKRVDELHDPSSLDDVVAEAPDPHHRAEAADFRARLKEALRGLPEHYRTILILREIEGLKYDEIADLTGRPLSTVKVTLHRGRKMLRDELRALRPDPALPDDSALRSEMADTAEALPGSSPFDAPLASATCAEARSKAPSETRNEVRSQVLGEAGADPAPRPEGVRRPTARQLQEVSAHA